MLKKECIKMSARSEVISALNLYSEVSNCGKFHKEVHSIINNNKGGLGTLIMKWSRGKMNLYKMFSKHENWNEDKLSIVTDITFPNEFNEARFHTVTETTLDMIYRRHGKIKVITMPPIRRVMCNFIMPNDYSCNKAFKRMFSKDFRKEEKPSRQFYKMAKEWDILNDVEWNRIYTMFCDLFTKKGSKS